MSAPRDSSDPATDDALLRESFDLFLEVCDLAPEASRAELDRRCADRPALRSLVERLLERERRERGERLRTGEGGKATLEGIEAVSSSPVDAPAGALAGRYRLIKLLGEGGSGAVYEAEQRSPRRLVALKLVRSSAFGGESALRRFALEAEVLARLQHPGIAQVYEAGIGPEPIAIADAGTRGGSVPSGPAWIAMELVRGQPIDVAVRRRESPLAERIELLLEVCDAVAFAHQKGVIHRDLKPANILVLDDVAASPGAAGRVKVLDFGIARVIGPEWATAGGPSEAGSPSLLTGPGQLLGTLPYMSPEQVAGDSDAIDVRSDVYSLGVVLYELLVGRRPFDVKGRPFDEAARVVRHEDAAPPSRVAPPADAERIRGDLDAIALRALAKNPAERYRSVAALADDLRAHLAGEPIAARSNSAFYVIARRARKHRIAIGATILVLLSIVAVAVRATVDAERFSQLAEEAHVAERTAQRASEALARSLSVARVERARLLAATGNLADAIETLRSERPLRHDPTIRWAAREIAARHPCVRHWAPHVGQVRVLGWDGDTILSAAEDGRVVASAAEGATDQQPLACLDLGSPVNCGAFDPIARRLVVGCDDGAVRAIDPDDMTTSRILCRHAASVRSVSLTTADSGVDPIVISGDARGVVRLTRPDAESIELLRRTRSASAVLAINERLFAVGDDGGDVVLVTLDSAADPPTIRPVAKHDGTVLSLAVDRPRGRLLSGATDRTVNAVGLEPTTVPAQVTDVANGSVRVIIVDEPTGDVLTSGWWTLDRWDESFRSRRQLFAPPTGSNAVLASFERGRALTAHADGSLRLWALTADPINGGGRFLRGAVGRVTATLGGSGRLIALGDGVGNVTIVDAADGRALRPIFGHSRRVRGLALSPDDSMVASAGDDGLLQVADTMTGEVLGRAQGVEAQTSMSVAFAPDGRRLAAAFEQNQVRIFEIPTMQVMATFRGADRQILALAWAPDGRSIALTSRDQSVRLFDDAGEPLATMVVPDAPWTLAFSPDGHRIAVGEWSRSIAIVDATNLALQRRIVGGGGLVTGLAWLREAVDGRSASRNEAPPPTIVASFGDGAVRVFDPSDGRELFEFRPFAHPDTISCSVDDAGKRMVISGTSGDAGVWEFRHWDEWAADGAGLRESSQTNR